MNSASEFNKSKYNSSPTKSSLTNPHSDSGKSRGVEEPVSTDAALIGDTRHELHSKPLPRKMGPNYGAGNSAPSDEFRPDTGEGASCL
jgi:hypothetical protein